MSGESKAQREFMRDLRTQNSIRYAAKTTMPLKLRNIYIIKKTMEYNNLSGDQDSLEARRVRAYNTFLMTFTVLFELLVLGMQFFGFFICFGSGKRRRKSW